MRASCKSLYQPLKVAMASTRLYLIVTTYNEFIEGITPSSVFRCGFYMRNPDLPND